MCLASVNLCIASDFASVVLPSSYLRKNDEVMLYSKNLEEVFCNKLVETFALEKNYNAPRLSSLKQILTTNPQLNSMISGEEKVVIVSKICGANKVISVKVKYSISDINKNVPTPFDNNALMKDNSSLRISTRIEVYDTNSDRCVWTNTYYKSLNFDSVNSKDITLIEDYYAKLADKVLVEIKSNAKFRPIESKKPVVTVKEKRETPKKQPKAKPKKQSVRKPVQQPSETKLKPQLQLNENAGKEVSIKKNADKKVVNSVKPKQKVEKKPVTKPVKKNQEVKKEKPVKQKVEQKPVKQPKGKKPVKEKTRLKLWDNLKNNIQVDVKPSTPTKEYAPTEVEAIPMNVQPTNSNMHVKMRMNSKKFTPKYDSSINDI